jgi:hypothetical protein
LCLCLVPVGAAESLVSEQELPLESWRTEWTDDHLDSGRSFDEQLDYQRHFRSQFDFLDESDTAIGIAMSAAAGNGSFGRWGIEMTDEEYAEMSRRDRVQREFPLVAGAAVGDDWSEELLEGLDPNGSFGAFAGRWIDQQNGGRLVVALVPEHPEYASAIRRAEEARDELVQLGKLEMTDVVFIDAEFSADDLHRVNREFRELYLTNPAIGDRRSIGMSASMNPVENRVDLYAESAFLRAAGSFAAGYPEGLVEVVEVPDGALRGDDSVDPEDDWGAGNWHAGAKIDIFDGDIYGLGACQWGATARTTSYVYVVTAAHCLGYDDNDLGVTSWWNDYVSNDDARGIRTYGGDDWIVDPNDHTYVVVYHGVYGDLARLSVSETQNVDDYDCYLEDSTLCGQEIWRREYTYETEIGDTKCVALASRGWICATVNSNDAPISGYDNLRGIDTNSGNHSQDGDSGAGVYEDTLMMGIVKGHTGWWGYDTYMTHAYYILYSTGASAICGTSGVCNN